jgi:F0F1-type ATP synthase membrane subunit b/b'
MNTSEFENHLVFEKLGQLNNRISEEEVRNKIELEKLNFYDSFCKYISDRLKLTIPVLVQVAELNALANEIEAGFTQINNFIGNNNIGHLNNADANFNSAMTRLRNFPLPFSKNDFNFSKSISNFESIVKSKFDDVENENKKLKEELKKVQENLTAKQNEINSLSQLLTTKTNEINNLTSTFQTNYDNIKNTANQNFENDRKTYRTEITTDRDTFRKEITQDRDGFKKEIETKIGKIDNDTSNIVESISTKLEEAKKLVNVIGNVGVTGNYQNIANQHNSTANFWRALAIIFMTVMSGLLIYAIWDVSSANYDWIKSVIRIIAAAALSYPATYAARESSKHRKLETLNRKLELELASLTPFIELHSEEQKREIKSKLVDKYFGNHFDISEDKASDSEELSLGGFEKLLKAILPFMKK